MAQNLHYYIDFSSEEIKIEKDTFDNIYKSVNDIPLNNNELSISNNIIDLIENLRDINESNDEIIEFIKASSNNPSGFKVETIKDLSKYNFNTRMDIVSTYSKVSRYFNNSFNSLIDTLCYLELLNKYDFVLENKAIFQRFSFSIKNDFSIKDPIFIVNPSAFFMRKWFKYNPANKRLVLFCLPDDNYKIIIENKYNNNGIKLISYSEMKNFLSDRIYIPTNTLFFGNHIFDKQEKSELLDSILSHIKNVSTLYYYDYDYEFTTNTGITNMLFYPRDSKDIDIKNYWLFPSRVNNEVKHKRTILLGFQYGYINETYDKLATISKYQENKKYNISHLSSNIFLTTCNKSDLFSNNNSLRNIYRNDKLNFEKKSENKKIHGEQINLTDDIPFVFVFNDNKTRIRTKCYFEQNGTAIADSIVAPSKFKSKEEAFEWAKRYYPFMKTSKGICIQQLVSENIGCTLTDKQISFGTVLYTNFALYDSLPFKIQNEIKFLFYSDISVQYINQITKDNLLNFLLNIYSGNKRGIHIYEVLSALEKFYDLAIENGNTDSNTAKIILKELKKNERNVELAEVNDALTLKNMYVNEINYIYNDCLLKVKKDNPFGVATLIRLFTALEPNIICSLLWKDFISFKHENKTIYQLIIRRQTNNDGTEFIDFERKHHYRLLPIPTLLAQVLCNEKDKQLHTIANNNEDYLLDCTIVSGNNNILFGQARILSPIKLYEYNRKLFLNKKLHGRKLEVPDNKGGTLETNIDYYIGDIFKTNLRHYCMIISGDFYLDEVLYMLGNIGTSTFYTNYFDFRNSTFQFLLFVKLEKMWRMIIK